MNDFDAEQGLNISLQRRNPPQACGPSPPRNAKKLCDLSALAVNWVAFGVRSISEIVIDANLKN